LNWPSVGILFLLLSFPRLRCPVIVRAHRFAIIAVIAALVLTAVASSAHAYALAGAGLQWPQPGGKGTSITLTYSFQNMFDGGIRGPGAAPHADGLFYPDGPPLPNDLIKHSIEQALGLWASVVPVSYVEVPDTDLSHGQVRFMHIYINGVDPPDPTPPVAKAQAYFPSLSGSETDVQFDEADPWQEKGTTHIPDIFGAVTHELGHTLGLNHSDDPNAVMYWIFQRFQGLGTGHLTADDIAGVQSIYGAGRGTVTPLVPEPGSLVLAVIGAVLLAVRRCWR
jgi:Matrixin